VIVTVKLHGVCLQSLTNFLVTPKNLLHWNKNLANLFEQSACKFQQYISNDPDFQFKIKGFSSLNILDVDKAADNLNKLFMDAASKTLKKQKKQKNKKKQIIKHQKAKKSEPWFDKDLHCLRGRLISFGKILSFFPRDPQVRGKYYRLLKEYSKTVKYTCKRRKYKSDMLNKISEIHENNPKAYWNMLSKLRNDRGKKSTV
jgi:hypothetical protein